MKSEFGGGVARENLEKQLKNNGFCKISCRVAFRSQEPPKDGQEPSRALQERPGAAQGRPKREPRAAKSGAPGGTKSGPEEAQGPLSPKGRKEAQHGPQDDVKSPQNGF